MEPERLSLIVQISALVVVFLFTLISSKKENCLLFAAIFMFIINIIAQIVIAGGGPGACLGMIALPSLGIMVAFVTFWLLEALGLKKDKHKE